MTKEKAEKILPVIQAIINGQKIQVNINNRWEDVDENHNCAFLPESYEYRIKLEPKYRPFKGAEECWNEMQKHHPFGWIKPKGDDTISKFMLIDSLMDEVVTVRTNIRFNYQELLEHYTFADGTPFGVKVEE